MRILLDADTLLEFFRNRSEFIGKVEYLSEIFRANSSIQVYLSKPGLDKIVSLQALNEKESEQLVAGLRKRIKILRVTKAVVKKASSSSALDYESAVEIHLAIKAHIGAIVTHKPSDFSSEELNVITLSDLQQRNHLEVNFSKNIKDLPAVLVINSEQISNLDKAFYHLPSYTDVKSLEPKESSHQLDITCSSAKVSIASDDKSSLRSKRFQAIEKFLLDNLSIKALDLQSFVQLEAKRIGSLAAQHLAYENSLGSRLTKDMLQAGKAYSAIEILSIRSPDLQSIEQFESLRIGSLAATSIQAHESLLDTLKERIDRGLSIKYPDRQSIGKLKSTRIGDLTATVPQPHENYLGSKLIKDELQMAKWLSLAVDSLSIKSPIPQPIRQLKSTIFGDLTATAPQPYENSLGGKLTKDTLQMAKGLSLAVDSLSIRSPDRQSIRQIESTKIGGIAATAPQPYENSIDGKLTKDMLQMEKGLSLAVDSLSIKSQIPRPTRQLESKRFGGIADTAIQSHESLLNTLKERIDLSSQINPLFKEDRSGLLSQIKLLESR